MKKIFRRSQKPAWQRASTPNLPQSLLVEGDTVHPWTQPRYTVPPVPNPYPHELIAVLVVEDGILLRHVESHRSERVSTVKVTWGQYPTVKEILQDDLSTDPQKWDGAPVVFGILGILNLHSLSYLLLISGRTVAGNYFGQENAVYGVKSVSAIPLEPTRARAALSHITLRQDDLLRETTVANSTSDPGRLSPSPPLQTSKVKFVDGQSDNVEPVAKPKGFSTSELSSGTSTPISDSGDAVVSKALASRLSFWNKLSKRQKIVDPDEDEVNLVDSNEENDGTIHEEPEQVIDHLIKESQPAPASKDERLKELDDKILKGVIREFTKGGMYFSYNIDITTSLPEKQREIRRSKRSDTTSKRASLSPSRRSEDDEINVFAEPNASLPLWRRVSKQFWWNENILQPFIDCGLHPFILPVMQGFFQSCSFNIPRIPEASETGLYAPVDYIVISRRSRDRAGLRYQRRGVDDDANVANFVETESLTRVEREGNVNVFSYIQIRGSIPLYWTQPGYNLKPAPVLSPERNHLQNVDAMKRHFVKTISRYGPMTIVNLAEQRGKESTLCRAYESAVSELSLKDIRFVAYDFHAETKGMKYENISKLIHQLDKTFDQQGYTWYSGKHTMSQQKAVYRINCIDCLDRTNVVQSAFARHVLSKQLSAVALLDASESGRTETDIVFNDVWANNGDAVSRAYAGTSALKGDYTRTGKRDLGGMLNDGMNSLARMYSSTFSDWFAQAIIDYVLGYRSLSVFSEFLLKLQSTDPRERIRLYKIRAEAIATSVSRVLSEGESLLSGWTLFSPSEVNVRISDVFEEKVVLLSVRALYVVSYDYELEKVTKYIRVPLGQITGIRKGEYILSTLEEGSKDPLQNYGFTVSYLTDSESTRVTSYSVRNSSDQHDPIENGRSTAKRTSTGSNRASVLTRALSNSGAERADYPVSFVAFKAFPVDPARARRTTGSFEETADDLSLARDCKEAIDMITGNIVNACKDVGNERSDFVIEQPIVSLAEAQQSTTVIAKLEYGLKRLLWLGS